MRARFRNNFLPIILFTIFVDLIGFGIIIPIIPQLLANPTSEFYILPAGQTISQGYIMLGFLTASFSIMQFLSAPILGQLSDRFGRKPILAISLVGTAISYVIFAIGILTANLPILFLSRAFAGLTGGSISVAQAAIADISRPQDRAKNFGLMGAAFGLGFIVGPLIGGALSNPAIVSWFSPTTPFFFASLLSLANILFVLFIFKETHKHMNKDLSINISGSLSNIYHAAIHKDLRELFAVVFLFNAGFTFFTTFFSVFLIIRLSFDQSDIGLFFSYIGIWLALAQAFLTGYLARKYSEITVVKFGIFLAGIVVMLYFLPRSWTGLLFIAPLMAISIGVTFSNLSAIISRSVEPKVQGEVLGISASVSALAQSIPPILSGYIAASLNPESPILISSVVIFASGIIFWFFYRVKKLAPIHDVE